MKRLLGKSRCNTSLINWAHNLGSGFNHCTSSIPFGLQAFNVDFVSTDNKVLEGCNYAFLLDNSRPEILESIKIMEKLGFNPVVLDWQIHNWTNGWREMLDSFNNRQDFQCDFDTSSFGSYGVIRYFCTTQYQITMMRFRSDFCTI